MTKIKKMRNGVTVTDEGREVSVFVDNTDKGRVCMEVIRPVEEGESVGRKDTTVRSFVTGGKMVTQLLFTPSGLDLLMTALYVFGSNFEKKDIYLGKEGKAGSQIKKKA